MFYLHGALHLYSEEGQLCKHRSGTEGLCLTELIRESLNRGRYPVFVAEGSTEHKSRHIHENVYLAHAFDQFSSVQGDLIIFGHSLGLTDGHILDGIARNRRLSNIYVGLYGDPELPLNQATQATARRLRDQRTQLSRQHPLEFYFYSSESACVWDDGTEEQT